MRRCGRPVRCPALQGTAARDGAGWHGCLDGLETLLDGGEVPRPYDADAWRGVYEEYKRRGFPATAPLPSEL